MMPVALNRMSRSAEAMGPFGLRTPSLQPPSVAAPITTRASRADRILDLLCPETGGTARGADQQLDAASACNSAGAQPRAPAAWMTIGSQHCWLTAPRADRTGREWKTR